MDFLYNMDLLIAIIALIVAWMIFSKRQQRKTEQHRDSSSKYPTQNRRCYYTKKRYISPTEMRYAYAIQRAIPTKYRLLPQVCLASIIEKHSDSKYQSELFRIVDFGIFDENYNVKLLIEINDSTHKQADRRERDAKVKDICVMANIPLITFWTEYGVDEEYIRRKINQYIHTGERR